MTAKKITRRGIPFSPEVAPLVSRMPTVDEYRESLLRLQGVWDSLSMLGQMSGTLPDIAATRSAFQALTETLLDSLGRCLLSNVVQSMRNQGQVAIDILVRNLFERTADIGFLSTDTAVREFMQAALSDQAPDAAQRQRLVARFAEYTAKYSVYDDVVLIAPDGRVLARLDQRLAGDQPCNEPWLADALAGAPYVEHYGPSATMGGRAALLYAAAIRHGSAVLGVMCLSFRLTDEMRSVFEQLLPPGDPAVIALVDAQGTVLASSDRWQLPLGAQLPANRSSTTHEHLRFAGREYLGVSANANPYEGYHGPGWSARVLVPIDQAFERRDEGNDAGSEMHDVLARVDTQGIFSEELRSIPPEALRIQRDLSRVLWNGKLQPAAEGASVAFAATLLREVGITGERIRQVFDQATQQLHQSTLSAVFEQARHHARLAIDIMDRNLYERANDCRWWALDGVLRQVLAQPRAQRDARAAASVLARINSLYTVYSLLVLFDTQGEVVAVSDPAAGEWVGRTLDAPWVRDTLNLRDAQSFARSAHGPTALYGERPTYVFAAALRSPDAQERVVGGIAIVFDGTPQFEAMLSDSLPQGHDAQAAGLLVTRDGRVVSSTDPRWASGESAPALPGLQSLARGEATTAVIDIDDTAYVAGYAMAGGYREYGSLAELSAGDIAGVVLLRLGQHMEAAPPALPSFEPARIASRGTAGTAVSVASFACAGQWYGIPGSAALQALQRPRLATIANAPAHVLGMTMFEGQMLPVIDLAHLRSGRSPTDIDAPTIVAQGPSGQRFALRVDELGPVFDVAERELQLVQHGASNGDKLLRGDGATRQMLILLDVNRLIAASGAIRQTAVTLD